MSEFYSPAEDSYFLHDILNKELPKLLEKNKDLKLFEMGGGSGINLKTALNLGIKKQNIFSSDINPEAVKKCKKLGFNCVESDLFEKGDANSPPAHPEKYDIIIFNPPYLPLDKKEPKDSRIATTGGKKGSEVINRFLKQAKKYLEDEGRIFLLVSSKTQGIDFLNYKKKILGKKKLFFEELIVWELKA